MMTLVRLLAIQLICFGLCFSSALAQDESLDYSNMLNAKGDAPAKCDDCSTGIITKTKTLIMDILGKNPPSANSVKKTEIIPIAPFVPLKKIDLPPDVIKTPLPKDDKCGPPGHPKLVNIKGVDTSSEFVPSVGTRWVDAVNSKGDKYKAPQRYTIWTCDTRFATQCNEEEKMLLNGRIVPGLLEKAAAIADYFHADNERSNQQCRNNLRKFYDVCSPMRGKTLEQRFHAISSYAREVTRKVSNLNPHTIACIAGRESVNLEPMELNASACMQRLRGHNDIVKEDKNLMSKWKSTAFGMHQEVWSTFQDEWPSLKDQRMLSPPQGQPHATYGSVFTSPMKLFKKMIGDPKMQMEMIARYLGNLEKKGYDHISAISIYDTRSKENYVDPVLTCTQCLDKNPNNVECLPFHAHAPVPTDAKGVKK